MRVLKTPPKKQKGKLLIFCYGHRGSGGEKFSGGVLLPNEPTVQATSEILKERG